MGSDDPWLGALRRQAELVQSARRDLDEARRTGFAVIKNEIALEIVEESYHRYMTDAPRVSVLRHLRERISGVRP